MSERPNKGDRAEKGEKTADKEAGKGGERGSDKPAAKPRDKFAFTWQPWAGIQGFYAGIFILMGGIVSMWYTSKIIAGVNIATSAIVIALEYPLPGIDKLGFLSKNYYVRALLYLAFVAPGILQAPTHTGVFCLFCAAVTYLWAAICGEPLPPAPKRGGGGGGARAEAA
eukprot:jgi/Hompol1/5262/HPOL_001884-RA